MSASSQTFVIAGKIAKDPEYKFTPSGTQVLKYSLPLEIRVNVDGEYKNETQWWGVVEFGKMAERHSKIYHKGTIISVAGKMTMPRVSDSGQVWLNLEALESSPLSDFGNPQSGAAAARVAATQDEIPF